MWSTSKFDPPSTLHLTLLEGDVPDGSADVRRAVVSDLFAEDPQETAARCRREVTVPSNCLHQAAISSLMPMMFITRGAVRTGCLTYDPRRDGGGVRVLQQ